MYEVDIARIKHLLAELQTCLTVLDDVHKHKEQKIVARFAAARALHIAIECVTDIGTALIDGFIMRDPGSYEDIVEIMKDENVLPAEEADHVKRLVEYRRKLVTRYLEIGPEDMVHMTDLAQSLQQFPERITDYLEAELGQHILSE